jgi:hypothetical protein
MQVQEDRCPFITIGKSIIIDGCIPGMADKEEMVFDAMSRSRYFFLPSWMIEKE